MPTSNSIGQVFYVVFFRNGKWAHVGNGGSTPRGTTFMNLRDLFGQFSEIRVTFPNSYRISNATLAVDNKKLSMFSTFLGL